ncbi:MAG: hypothetical protein K6F00_09540 [Lachnospiraceae bacterium]|nr:hypothetical protein [Lachnospiraceae bacterium]
MSKLKYSYIGYTKDIEKLLDTIDTKKLKDFRDYMETKANDNSQDREKIAAAQEICSVIDSFGYNITENFVNNFRDQLGLMEKYLGEKQDKSRYEFDYEDGLSKLENQLLLQMDGAKRLQQCLSKYNAVDKYKEFSDEPLIQDMYDYFNKLSNASVRVNVIKSKNVQMELAKQRKTAENKQLNFITNLKELIDNDKNLSWDEIKKQDTKLEKKYNESEKEYKDLSSEEKKQEYESKVKECEKSIHETEVIEKEISDKIEMTQRIQGEDEAYLKQVKRYRHNEIDILENLEKLRKERLPYKVGYTSAKENLEFEEKKELYTLDKVKAKLEKKGEWDIAKEYYNKRLTYESWKFTETSFNEFLKKHKDNIWGKIAYFEPERWKILEATYDPNSARNKNKYDGNMEVMNQVSSFKNDLEDVFTVCPDKDLLKTLSKNKNRERYDKVYNGFVKNVRDSLEINVKQANTSYRELPTTMLNDSIIQTTKEIQRLDFKERGKDFFDQYKGKEYLIKGKKDKSNSKGKYTKIEDISFDDVYNIYIDHFMKYQELLEREGMELKSKEYFRRKSASFDNIDKVKYIIANEHQVAILRVARKGYRLAFNVAEGHFDPYEVDVIIDNKIKGIKRKRQLTEELNRAKENLDYFDWQVNSDKRAFLNNRMEAFNFSGMGRRLKREHEEGKMSDEDYKAALESQKKDFENELESLKENYVKDLNEKKKISFISAIEDDLTKDINTQIKTRADLTEERKKYSLIKVNLIIDKSKSSPERLNEEINKARENRNQNKAEFDKTRTKLNKMDSVFSEYSSYRDDINRIYGEFNGKCNNKELVGGLKERVGHYKEMFGAAKRETHTDTGEYLLIQEKLNGIDKLQDASGLKDIFDAVVEIKKAADNYLKEKAREWRPFPSTQRIYRLKYARSIKAFCESQLNLIAEPGIMVSTQNLNYMEKVTKLKDTDRVERKEFFRADVLQKYSNELGIEKENIIDKNLNSPELQSHFNEQMDQNTIEQPMMNINITERKKETLPENY